MNFYKKILTTLIFGVLILGTSGVLQAQQNNTVQWMQQARDAGIEQPVLKEFQEYVNDNKITEDQLASIMRSAISVSDQDLPADIIINKALEGFSKGVPSEQVVSVVGQLEQSVAKAAAVVDPWMKKPEVQQMLNRSGAAMPEERFRNELTKATSKSFMQNIPSEALDKVFDQVGSGSVLSKSGPAEVIAAVGILPDLSSSGNNPKVAGEFIVRALKGGFNANELQKLPAAMQVAQQRSQLPAASVIEGVAGQMQGNIPAKQILQNLFNGKVGGGPPGDIPRGIDNNKGRGNSNSNGNSNGN
ncbi:MAG: hypothetical protein U5J63_02230 [Fodinibius sp.]|nr:hypothetical protein [Fodinibius sp.]